ncbi:MAG: hypothetical protein J1D99_02820 [Campylobacter sp.]|nr:hypothetical protein [Campylobacter sp.]
MDFLDSLKEIKKELEKGQEFQKTKKVSNKNTNSKENKIVKTEPKKTDENSIDEDMQKIFLKEEKLRDEFENFIKDTDIKKIF